MKHEHANMIIAREWERPFNIDDLDILSTHIRINQSFFASTVPPPRARDGEPNEIQRALPS
jgi:hypothetical protein